MTEKHYNEVPSSVKFPELEEEILSYWQENNTFQKSIDNRPSEIDGKRNDFVFYDGPPFANGLPHYGHLVTGYVKDIIPRYQTMKGKKVARRFGWDTHGLPAELQSEKELEVSGRLEILEHGIDNFNKHCEKSVLRFTDEWEKYVTRQARWVDFKNSYKTMDSGYMESVIWAFKSLWDKGLIYEDYRVVPYSWAVESPLSNFEIRMDNATRERQDPTVTVGFKLNDQDKTTYLCAWTTTPWTLPSNLALAVGSEMEYAFMENAEARYIFSVGALGKYAKEIEELGLEQTKTIKGSELNEATYTPLFDYFAGHENAFRVIATDWVEDGEGTGCVHMAPGFGEIDMEACRDAGIKLVVPVDSRGLFTSEVSDYTGQHVFETNKDIARRLREAGQLIRFETYVHNYPHCWRTDEPIIYKAINGWYVKVTEFKDRMVELNQGINWIPEHIKDGQFGRWLENAKDWNISRDRFWGAPIPVWMSDDPQYPRIDVYGSLEELEKDFGKKPESLHRPHIDDLTRANPDDPTGKSTMRRVEAVLDCWFESGSMPFAQMHYPFENKEWFENNFPGDFIVEYVAQTRGWFYTLMVMSTALFDRAPFKNCICHGVVLDENHEKLSKRLRNYPDPVDMFNKHGSDAMRWYMVASPLMNGGDLAIDLKGEGIGQTVRQVNIPMWNAYYFFTLYANADGIKAKSITASSNVLDTYILAKLRTTAELVETHMDNLHLASATTEIHKFLDTMNNWYIRRSRERFWSGDQDAFDTLYTVLETLCKISAPFLPMLAEKIYTGLTGNESVHLADWADVSQLPQDETLTNAMDIVRETCSTALGVRETHKLRVRQPLKTMTVVVSNSDRLSDFADILKEEVNVKEIVIDSELEKYGSMQLVVNPTIGKRLGSQMKDVMMQSKAGNYTMLDNGNVEVAGVELSGDDYTMRLQTTEGMAAQTMQGGMGVVILDTEITPELEAEGFARDVIRAVQNARKDANLDVSDRIVLTINTDETITGAINQFNDFIKSEVLANELNITDASGDFISEDIKIGKSVIKIGLSKS
ncbi:MAG: isoleucine--tRNA ligase [Alphaproteobacteria bacterium]